MNLDVKTAGLSNDQTNKLRDYINEHDQDNAEPLIAKLSCSLFQLYELYKNETSWWKMSESKNDLVEFVPIGESLKLEVVS